MPFFLHTLAFVTRAPLALLTALLLALTACSSDDDDNGGDPTDAFVLGEWIEGDTTTESDEGDPVPSSPWAPATAPQATDVTFEQTRTVTITTTRMSIRIDTRTCAVTVNGDEDDPALVCGDEQTTRTITTVLDPIVVEDEETRDIYNVTYDTSGAANPLSLTLSGSVFGTDYDVVNLGDSDAFFIDNIGTGTASTYQTIGANRGIIDTRVTEDGGCDSDRTLNGALCYTLLPTAQDLVDQGIATSLDAIVAGSHAQDILDAHNDGWTGSGSGDVLTVPQAQPVARLTALTDKILAIAPGVALTPFHSLSANSEQISLTTEGNVLTIHHCNPSLVNTADCTPRNNTISVGDEDIWEVVDDFAITVGLAVLLRQKFSGLSGAQYENLILATLDDDKSLNIRRALSPVGELQ